MTELLPDTGNPTTPDLLRRLRGALDDASILNPGHLGL
jgi:FAD/FMN-containing dehydrogenase